MKKRYNCLTVSELIALLQKQDPNAKVLYFDGQEGLYGEIVGMCDKDGKVCLYDSLYYTYDAGR